MLRRLKPHLTYANVMVTILAFAALGTGGAYAANEWNGSNIQDGTLTGADIQDLSLGLPDYGANSISTGKLKDQDVRTADLRDLGVTNPKIAWDSVSSGKVIDNNLTGADINESTLSGVRLSGLELVNTVSGSFNSVSPKTAYAGCPAGKRVVGAGYDLGGGTSGNSPNATTDVVVKDLIPGTVTVTVQAIEEDATSLSWRVAAYAVCADAG
jgi:hypothetical protein